MANRMQWNPNQSVGNDTLDAQHRRLVDQCNELADCLAGNDEGADQRFRKTFDELMAGAREHYAAETAQLAQAGYPDADQQAYERDEFDFLAAEIVTAENFDKEELHRFLVLWWTGHIAGCVRKHRDFLAQQPVN